jgi:MFS family permease
VFFFIALGIAALTAADGKALVIGALVLLGMGNGMTTLARATVIADRYGAAAYGSIAGVAASATTAARAIGPVTAAAYAAATGYTTLLWTLAAATLTASLLAYRSERTADQPSVAAPTPKPVSPPLVAGDATENSAT